MASGVDREDLLVRLLSELLARFELEDRFVTAATCIEVEMRPGSDCRAALRCEAAEWTATRGGLAAIKAVNVPTASRSAKRRAGSRPRFSWTCDMSDATEAREGARSRERAEHALERIDDVRWRVPKTGRMRVEGLIFADDVLGAGHPRRPVRRAGRERRAAPGIVGRSMAMPTSTGATDSRSAASRHSTRSTA